jgi:general secretion pathway protein D
MSRRLLSAVVSAALFLAVSPVNAEPPPAKLVSTTYQVADLVIPVPNVLPAQATSAEPKKQPTMEDALIKLITSTVAPQSWDSMGGHGHIDYYPLGMTLIVHNTPIIQEQIADLLAALRRLQDQEVAYEVRFISLSEAGWQRLNENFHVDASSHALCAKKCGCENDPARVMFLKDVQVVQLLEAAQGDQAANIMQAPKLTLFNGQLSTIQATDQQFFVTAVNVSAVEGQPVCVPKNEPFETGVKVTLQPVISADHRYIQTSLHLNMAALATEDVPLSPVMTQIKPQKEDGTEGEPVVFTQFIQLPRLNKLAVEGTLSIPDGGTALLSGWQWVKEHERRCGPPVLRDLPYINELFRTETARETEHILVMVTPRIILTQEQEEKKTAEESEAIGPSPKTARPKEGKVGRLLEKYHQACAAGHLEEARKIAVHALKLDPTCFDTSK